MLFDERQTFAATEEDLEQNTTDILVVMQRHVLVIQKAQRTVDVPLLQYSHTTTARLTQETVELPKPQFINKVVDVRVMRQRQVPQSKWR